MKPLGEVVVFLDHLRRPVKSNERNPGPYPYFGANGQQGTIDGFLFDEPLVLLAEDGGHFDTPDRGIAYRISGRTWVNNHAHVLRARAGVDRDYLYRVLENFDARPYLTGSTRAKLTKGSASRFPIPLPALADQKRIAAVLDQVDTLRAKRREAIALLDDLTRSVFLDMFGDPLVNPQGWDRLRMEDFLIRIDSGKSPQCLNRPARDGEWGVLKLGAVTRCVFRPGENKALPAGEVVDSRSEVRAGDLLFTRKNTPDLVAASAYIRETPKRLLMPDLIFRLVTPGERVVNKVFLHSLLTYPAKRKQLQELATGSAASMLNISKAKLMEFKCEIPPIDLQEKFARRADGIEAQREVHLKHLAALDELFTSLQQRAFAGTLWDHDGEAGAA